MLTTLITKQSRVKVVDFILKNHFHKDDCKITDTHDCVNVRKPRAVTLRHSIRDCYTIVRRGNPEANLPTREDFLDIITELSKIVCDYVYEDHEIVVLPFIGNLFVSGVDKYASKKRLLKANELSLKTMSMLNVSLRYGLPCMYSISYTTRTKKKSIEVGKRGVLYRKYFER